MTKVVWKIRGYGNRCLCQYSSEPNCVARPSAEHNDTLVAGVSQRKPVFAPGSVRVGFVVNKVALGQVFLLEFFRFSPVIIIPPWLSVRNLWDEQ
jgi:hypothetical protein